MGDQQIIDRLAADGVTISAWRVRQWRLTSLIEEPDSTTIRIGQGAGRPAKTYSPDRLERVVSAARELVTLHGRRSPPELAVLLFIRGKPIAAMLLVTAVQELSASDTSDLTVDQLVDARAVLYGLGDIMAVVSEIYSGRCPQLASGVSPPRLEDARMAVSVLLAVRAQRDHHAATGISHRLWDLGWSAGGDDRWMRHPALAPVW